MFLRLALVLCLLGGWTSAAQSSPPLVHTGGTNIANAKRIRTLVRAGRIVDRAALLAGRRIQ
jgi:hypothetical protein